LARYLEKEDSLKSDLNVLKPANYIFEDAEYFLSLLPNINEMMDKQEIFHIKKDIAAILKMIPDLKKS
jgi:hypothetical protein